MKLHQENEPGSMQNYKGLKVTVKLKVKLNPGLSQEVYGVCNLVTELIVCCVENGVLRSDQVD